MIYCPSSLPGDRLKMRRLDWTLKVRTIEDLESLSNSLFSKPLLLDVEWKWRRPHRGYDAVSVEYSLVVVNTSNRYVRLQLEEGFKEARRSLKAGRKFSIEFDFTRLVVQWYTKIVREMEGGDDVCSCGENVGRYGRLCITNASKYWPYFRFNNHTCPYWCLCLPCCLLTYPCYEIHRQLSCTDVYFEMTGEVVFLEEVWDSFMSKFVLQQHLQVQDVDECSS
ncbi:uncharacterized protein [Ptychodera flava]|uniref:uncharacterized protein isoform X2 n=1 Tax=Ptychodera flava TaxID=63121 RepID=UPI00396A062E